jgi:hypothetical protein
MSGYEKRELKHNGVEYEIRITTDGQTTWVRAFRGDRPANGYQYSVTLEAQTLAVGTMYEGALVDSLAETAEDDVKNGRWEQYLAAVKAHQNDVRSRS